MNRSIAPLSLAALLLGAGFASSAAEAQPDAEPAEASAPAPRLRVGDATTNLLALQREGRAASATPRPLAGDIATRSYQRYLKSFDYPIPERYGTTVGGTSSNNSASGAR